MATRPDLDDDDDFSELYKAYTGPVGSSVSKPTDNHEKEKPAKRSHDSSDEEDERDPNAVPTDFTSREAKVWEAKSKATERNWKKRKEEEMICKICGESGHFTQGCPSTLGANRKSQDFFERVPARDPNVRALFTDKVIKRIEGDIGCKIRMDEKFLFVSGKDGLILSKGVDAVHKIISEENKGKNSSGSHMARSKSPECSRSPVASRFVRSESQRSHHSPRNSSQRSHSSPRNSSQWAHSSPRKSSQFQHRFTRQDRNVEDRMTNDFQRTVRNSPTAYGNDGAKGRPSRSKSPLQSHLAGNSYDSCDVQRHGMGSYSSDVWNSERPGSELHRDLRFGLSSVPQSLEELELEYKKEVMDLGRLRDQEEDAENYKHREAASELGENYIKKVSVLRGTHAKQWEEFLHIDAQRQQLAQQQHLATSGFGSHKQPTYSGDYDRSSVNPHYPGADFPLESGGSYPNSGRSYPVYSSPRGTYEFQRHRPGEYGRAYDRY